jgi:hypothetical protein
MGFRRLFFWGGKNILFAKKTVKNILFFSKKCKNILFLSSLGRPGGARAPHAPPPFRTLMKKKHIDGNDFNILKKSVFFIARN